MEYGRDYQVTVVPVELLEGEQGLVKVTEFDKIDAVTLRALLKGYKCTDDMLERIESESEIINSECSPVEFFITYNAHCFAACVTHTNQSLHLGHEKDILVQNEIMSLVESFPGSLKRAGTYQYLRSVDEKKKKIKVKKRIYEYPIFDISLRYLSLSKYKQVVNGVSEERYLMVLYVPA